MSNESVVFTWILPSVGVIGTIASILALRRSAMRTILVILFACLIVVGGVSVVDPDLKIGTVLVSLSILMIMIVFVGAILQLSGVVDIVGAIINLWYLRRAGIQRVHIIGTVSNKIADRLQSSQAISIMSASGHLLFRHFKAPLVKALHNRAALIRVLLADPDSQFTSELELCESASRVGQIRSEIGIVEGLLQEYISEANEIAGPNVTVGKVFVGYFGTHLRSNLIICDKTWGRLTLLLPPKRAVDSVTFDIRKANAGLLTDCSKHFDRCWELAERGGRVKQLHP